MNEFPQQPDDVRVLEHRSAILDALTKANDMKTVIYVQTIALLDLRDLLIMTIGVIGAISDAPAEAFPFVMGPAPGASSNGAGIGQAPQASAAPSPAWGPPPGQPAFGPPFVQPSPYPAPASYPTPPPPFQTAPPVYTEEQLRQLAQFYTPQQLAALLPYVTLQPPAPPAPVSPDTPDGTRPRSPKAPKAERRPRRN